MQEYKATAINLEARLKEPMSLLDFQQVCDNYFKGNDTLCNFVKNQARLFTKKEKGRRYTSDEKQYVLMFLWS